MKTLLFSLALLMVGATAKNCNSSKKTAAHLTAGCYKGKLVVKAACMNYTIAVTEGNMDTTLVNASWTDEQTGKAYSNVFALGSRCSFPPEIKEGDEFYFKLDSTTVQNCAVCMIYYPVPSRHLSIKVLNEPCTTD